LIGSTANITDKLFPLFDSKITSNKEKMGIKYEPLDCKINAFFVKNDKKIIGNL